MAVHPPFRRVWPVLGVLTALLGVQCAAEDETATAPPLALVATIPMPGVAGRIDHLALDRAGGRLFVAALGNDTVEVLDLADEVRRTRLEGLAEPQGVAWLPDARTLVVTNGGGSSAIAFAGPDLGSRTKVEVRADPDNVRYDPAAKRVWIGEGVGAQGALGALDPAAAKIALRVDLGGHPEAFELEAEGDRAFVNVPSRREVVVVDRKKGEVVARWRLPEGANFPMAHDEARGRLYAASRRPSRLYELDTATGALRTTLEGPGDVDDLFLDGEQHRLYAIAGAGVVRVFRLREDGPPERVGDVTTRSGARTGLFDPQGRRLFVAAPRRGSEDAAVLVFEVP